MWLNKFAGAAVKALEAEFVHQKIATAAEKSNFVCFLLGDADNISSKNRPFLWQSVYDNPDARQEVCNVESCQVLSIVNVCHGVACIFFQGLFQGRLIARTFLKHVLVLSSLPPACRVAERPIEALIVSIQAVRTS
jgi:hypothetical protein